MKRMGRPRKLTPTQRAEAITRKGNGESNSDIAPVIEREPYDHSETATNPIAGNSTFNRFEIIGNLTYRPRLTMDDLFRFTLRPSRFCCSATEHAIYTIRPPKPLDPECGRRTPRKRYTTRGGDPAR